MATLTVTGGDTDYRDGSPTIPASTTAIVFSTSIATAAQFNSSQFGVSGISNTVAITGDGNFNAIEVTLNEDDFSAAAWTFSTWAALDEVRIFGTADQNLITGGSKATSIYGGGGADFLFGGDGDDSFIYRSASDAVTGEIVSGGDGTDEVVVAIGAIVDLSVVTFLSIERLRLGDSATLDSDQVGAGAINQFEGSASISTVTVNGGSTDLSSATFTSWIVTQHFIVINGTSGADDLTGSSQNDTIVGGNGADALEGGGGDDTFVYNAATELVAGETIDGGAGTGDTLRVNVGQGFSLNVSGAGVLSNVEKVVFQSAGTVVLAGENVGSGAGLVNQITGSAGINKLNMFDSAIDLSGVTFTSWTAGEDSISLNGTAGNDIIVGSSQRDLITYSGGGIDSLSGGGGDDFFSVNTNAFAAGASINGGAGTGDEISTAGADFSKGTVVGIERLTFFDQFVGTAVSITVSGSQVRAGGITIVDGGNFIDTLTVKGSSVDLTGVTFTQWTAGTDKIVIVGAATASNLTGSSLADIINGGSANDTINGGAGKDALNGGLGNDTYVLGSETGDTITDTGGIDTVTSTISRSLASFASVENLILLGSAANGTGNGLGNAIRGNAGANLLLGEGGADVLTGDLGTDRMAGGTGADIFMFLTLGDSSKKKKLMDVIEDFSAEDVIDLSAIDAKKGGKDNHFKFIGKQGFHHKKGELHYTKKKGDIVVSGDVNGDGKADFAILIEDAKKAIKADFEL